MQTVIAGPPPAPLQAWLDRRQKLGLDTHDEVWEGVRHVAPAPLERHGLVALEVLAELRPYARKRGMRVLTDFNLGDGPTDFRVPDGGVVAQPSGALYVPTAVLVLEVLSPDDESFGKFAFYARHSVAEILIADPVGRTVTVWRRAGDGYETAAASTAVGVSADTLTSAVDWL